MFMDAVVEISYLYNEIFSMPSSSDGNWLQVGEGWD